MEVPMPPIEIYYAYSHSDEALRDDLEKHLSLLKWQGYITNWHDRRIVAGQERANEVDTHLDSAHIILLLISPDFMASPFCYGNEVKRAVERHERREAYVIPVILRPVYWEDAPFGKLQALPKDAKPLVTWQHRDEAFLDIVTGIRHIINELRTKQLSAEIKKVEQPEQIAHTVPPAILHSLQQNESAPPLPTPSQRTMVLDEKQKEICSLLNRIQKRLKQLEDTSSPNDTFSVWEYLEQDNFFSTIRRQIKITREYVISTESNYLLNKKSALVNMLDNTLEQINTYIIEIGERARRDLKLSTIPFIGTTLLIGSVLFSSMKGEEDNLKIHLTTAIVYLKSALDIIS